MNQKTNINTLAGQNFFNRHIAQLTTELAQAKLNFKITRLEAETGTLTLNIELAQAETTANTHQAFNIKVWLYNKDNEDNGTFRIFLEHNKGVADYPRTKEQIHAWAKQFIKLEYDFSVSSYDLKFGSSFIRNDSTDNINLYTYNAVSKIVALAKTLQTAKE
jgi:hypothetical protein